MSILMKEERWFRNGWLRIRSNEILNVQFDDNILMVTTFNEFKCINFFILDEPIDLTVWDELNIKPTIHETN